VGNQTRVLNGKTKSVTAPTTFPGVNRTPTKYSNVEYNFSTGTKRDGEVADTLLSALSQAAFEAGVYKVEVYSGRQPGSKGRRTGSGRHDTGLAVDVKLIKTQEDYENTKGIQYVNGYTSDGQALMTAFVSASVRFGIRGGGFSRGYMGQRGMHLDMLGQVINTSNTRVQSSYDSNTLAAWKSEPWFREAMYTAESDWKYFIALQSGTRYYSKTNTKWNAIV